MVAASSIVLLLLAPPPAPVPEIASVPLPAAIAHLDANRPAEAAKLLEPAVAADPANVPVRFNLAIAYSMLGRDPDAIEAFRKVLEVSPKLVEAQLNLGQLLVKTGRNSDAIPLLEQVAEAKPADARPPYLLARAYSGEQKWKESAAWFQKSIKLTPDDRGLLLEAAAVYEKSGMKTEAVEIYKASTEVGARERLGVLLMDAGDLEGAAAALEDVMRRSPTPAAAFALSTVYMRSKQPAKAIPLATYITQAEANNVDARLFLGRLLRDERRFPEAAQQFYAATQLKADSLEAWNEFAGMLMLIKNYEGAIKALDRSRELGGDTPGYWWFRATAFDNLHQPKPALESYQKFLSLSGGKFPDEEFKARQRARILEKEVKR